MSGPSRRETYLALLRAVNVGGRLVDTAALRELVTGLGYGRVRSWLATGNLLFDAPSAEAAQLEARLARETTRALGIDTVFFVRSAAEWATIVAHNPFPAAARDDPGHLVVVVLRDAPADATARRLQESIEGRELVQRGDRCLYVTYPDGIGRSKLTLARIEKSLGSSGTARNWNTVRKLDELARAASG